MTGPIEWRRYDGPIVLIEADHDPGDMGEPREFWDDDLKATCVVVPSLDFWWISPRSLRPVKRTEQGDHSNPETP